MPTVPVLRAGGTGAGLLEKSQAFPQNISNEAKSILFLALSPLNPFFLRIFLAVEFHLKELGLFLHDSMQKSFLLAYCLFVHLCFFLSHVLIPCGGKKKGKERGGK